MFIVDISNPRYPIPQMSLFSFLFLEPK
ncbi:hypothetical protein ACFFUS_22340 [Vibrio gallaecicus]